MLFPGQRVRAFAFLTLVVLVLAHLGIKALFAWAINDGFRPSYKQQSMHAIPLLLMPPFVLQLVTGLKFSALEVWWKELPSIAQVGVVLVFAAAVALVGAFYVGMI